MKKTNLDLAVALTNMLVEKGYVKVDQLSDLFQIKFDVTNDIEKVLDRLIEYNREHM